MRNLILVFVTLVFVHASASGIPAFAKEAPDAKKPEESRYVKNEIMVEFQDGVTEQQVARIIGENGCEITSFIKQLNIYRLKIPKDKLVPAMVNVFKKDTRVKWVEPVYVPELM